MGLLDGQIAWSPAPAKGSAAQSRLKWPLKARSSHCSKLTPKRSMRSPPRLPAKAARQGPIGSTSPTMNHTASVIDDLIASFGKIDVLVNNAAINPPSKTILDDTLEDWRAPSA